jgi:hypothetical protein
MEVMKMKNNKSWFYGIYGIEFIWNGPWADPELVWHKKSFNYYDVENALYSDYMEDKSENKTDLPFDIWVKKNSYLARYYLDNLKEHKIFY